MKLLRFFTVLSLVLLPVFHHVWAGPAKTAVECAIRKSFFDWVEKASLDELAKQNADFLKQIAPDGKVLPEYEKMLSQADYDFLMRDPNNIRLASDADRAAASSSGHALRTVDTVSVQEARAMRIAEQKGILPSPVDRSTRLHCDTVAGTGVNARHYSMKSVFEFAPHVPEMAGNRFDASLKTVIKELTSVEKLAGQSTSATSLTLRHLLVDLTAMKNPQKLEEAVGKITKALEEVNRSRPPDSQLEVKFILPLQQGAEILQPLNFTRYANWLTSIFLSACPNKQQIDYLSKNSKSTFPFNEQPARGLTSSLTSRVQPISS